MFRLGYAQSQPEVPSELAAAVVIGGTYEQLNEFRKWLGRDRRPPIYFVESTGGAATKLAQEFHDITESLDDQIWRKLEPARKNITFPELARGEERAALPAEESVPEFRYAIYPLLMSIIVDELASNLRR